MATFSDLQKCNPVFGGLTPVDVLTEQEELAASFAGRTFSAVTVSITQEYS